MNSVSRGTAAGTPKVKARRIRMRTLSYINFIIALLFMVVYAYQAVYLAAALTRRPKTFPKAKKQHRYGVLICARNEEAVIGQLLRSIRAQTYPADLLDVFVAADNCTDRTAEVARACGAVVFERRDRFNVGKGYAMRYLIREIYERYGADAYEGFFVFDADNVLDERFVEEMNNAFDSGAKVVTGYRNSKNFGDNWISAAQSLFFLRETAQLNRPRSQLGTSACVSGTGFLFSNELIREKGGWNYVLLTEDFEFTVDCILNDVPILFCDSAVLYDEQPTQLLPSLWQRARWIRGYLQVFGRYGGKMFKKMIVDGSFACFDMFMNNLPCLFLTLASMAFNLIMAAAGIATQTADMDIYALSMVTSLVSSCSTLWFISGVTALTERKRIPATKKQRVLGVLIFPLFVFTYAVAMLSALFSNIEWKPIKHKVALDADVLRDQRKK